MLPDAAMRGTVVRVVGVVGVVGTFALVWIVALVRFRSWSANDDLAILQLHLERIGNGDIPLVGAYSRLDFHHPGPLREWVFGATYWLSGRRASALPATAVSLNLAWVVAACAMGFRTGRRAGVVAAAVAAVLVMAGLDLNLHSPWNPYLAVLALYAALWGAAAVLVDGSRNWPVPVVAGSFAAQQHVSVLMLGAVAIAVVVAVAIRDVVGRGQGSRRLAAIGVTLAGLWSGPIIDLAKGGDSNVARLVRNGGDGDAIGLVTAGRHVVQLAMPWSIARGDALSATGVDAPPAVSTAVLVVLVVGLLVVLVASRGGTHPAREIGVLAVVAFAVLVLVTLTVATGFTPPLYPYLFAPSVGGLAIVTAAVTFAAAPAARRALGTRPAGLFVLVVPASAVLVAASWMMVGWSDLQPIATAGLQQQIDASVRAAVEPGEAYTIAAAGLVASVADGEVALAVEQGGGEPRSSRFALGLPDPAPGSGAFVVAMGDPLTCLLAADPGDRLVVRERSIASGLEVGVFQLAPDDPWSGPVVCGVAVT